MNLSNIIYIQHLELGKFPGHTLFVKQTTKHLRTEMTQMEHTALFNQIKHMETQDLS